MATLIPALGACTTRMTSGERRLAERLQDKLDGDQLVAFGQTIPAQSPRMFDEMVDSVIQGLDRKQIPSGQYQAVMIDEGHDFAPE